jgi:hypothetical protein
MVIEVTFDVTDVYISTTVSPVYVNVSFEAPSGGGGAEWGDITGTLSDQTDLQSALDAKFDDPTGTTSQYLRGDGSLATFPSLTGYVPYTGATTNVDLGTHRILAQNATISSSGSGDTVTLNHSSGSGIGLNITKGGNGEALYINKTSGSGNAATIIGTINATTLVKSGGTSSQFLKADGSVDSSVYVPTSREITINGVTFDLSANRTFTVGSVTGSGASGQVAYWTGTSAQSGSNNLFWDAANGRLGIGTNAPSKLLSINGEAEATVLRGSTIYFRAGAGTDFYIKYDSGDFMTYRSFSLHRWQTFGTTYDTRMQLFATGNLVLQNGGTFTDSGERLQVTGTMKVTGDTLLKGSTTSAGAFALTVQNSGGINLLRVRDEGFLLIGQASTSAAPTIYAFSGITGDRSLRIGIQSAGSLTPTPAFNINQESNYTYTSGTGEFTTITANFLPTSGTGTLAYLSIKGTINQTGGANGITRGLYVNPTLTAAADFRAIEWSNNSGWGLYGAGTAANYMAGNLLLGSTSNSGERLQVTGTMKVTGLLSLQTGLTSTGGLLTQNTSVNSGRMNLLNLRNTAGGYNAALNSSIAVSFTNRVTAGVWSDDFIELKVYDNGSTTSKSGYNFYTHNNQLTTANSVLAMSINGQSVGIGIETPNASAILDVTSTTQGFLPPRMTTTQKNAITSPAAGLVVYDTTLNKLCVYTTAWETITSL